MKKILPFLGVLLALALLDAFSRVPLDPPPGHLMPRYEKDSLSETRIASPRMAVLGDYRGFDLAAASVLFGIAGWVVLLLDPKGHRGVAGLLLTLGTGVALGLGLVELAQGSNFLDHEALARWVDPLEARWKGVFWLSWAAGLSLLGALLAAFRTEGPAEHSRD
ncbi:MAG TPA: hypothetical protein VHE12_03925 [bacterium]|nr:hypothetical protein [bacterium]